MSTHGNFEECPTLESLLDTRGAYAENWYLENLLILATQIANAPMAAICMGNSDSLKLRCCVGLSPSHREQVLQLARCSMEAHEATIWNCEDATATDIGRIKFFAGIGLKIYGQAVGAICVIDSIRRKLNKSQFCAFNILGEVISMHLQQSSLVTELKLRLAEADAALRVA